MIAFGIPKLLILCLLLLYPPQLSHRTDRFGIGSGPNSAEDVEP